MRISLRLLYPVNDLELDNDALHVSNSFVENNDIETKLARTLYVMQRCEFPLFIY